MNTLSKYNSENAHCYESLCTSAHVLILIKGIISHPCENFLHFISYFKKPRRVLRTSISNEVTIFVGTRMNSCFTNQNLCTLIVQCRFFKINYP